MSIVNCCCLFSKSARDRSIYNKLNFVVVGLIKISQSLVVVMSYTSFERICRITAGSADVDSLGFIVGKMSKHEIVEKHHGFKNCRCLWFSPISNGGDRLIVEVGTVWPIVRKSSWPVIRKSSWPVVKRKKSNYSNYLSSCRRRIL